MSILGDLLNDGAFDLVLEVSGETVSYRVVATDTTHAGLTASVIDQLFAITDDKANKKFAMQVATLAALPVTPARGDTITHDSEVWTIIDIKTIYDGAAYELRTIKPQSIS